MIFPQNPGDRRADPPIGVLPPLRAPLLLHAPPQLDAPAPPLQTGTAGGGGKGGTVVLSAGGQQL